MVGVAGLRAAALVDGDVDDHRTLLHLLDHLLGDQLGRGGAGHQHAADHQVGAEHLLLDGIDGGEDGVQRGAELQVELVEPLAARHRAR